MSLTASPQQPHGQSPHQMARAAGLRCRRVPTGSRDQGREKSRLPAGFPPTLALVTFREHRWSVFGERQQSGPARVIVRGCIWSRDNLISCVVQSLTS